MVSEKLRTDDDDDDDDDDDGLGEWLVAMWSITTILCL